MGPILVMSAHIEPNPTWANPIFMVAYRLPLVNLPPCEDCGEPCDEGAYVAIVATYASKN
jgi:hypothetical protein